MRNDKDTRAFIAQLNSHVETLQYIVDCNMVKDGDTEETSQRICLLNKLNDLDMVINGIEPADLRNVD